MERGDGHEGYPASELLTESDENLWTVMAASVTVNEGGRPVFHLTSGMDVDAEPD